MIGSHLDDTYFFMKNFHEWLMTPSKVWFGPNGHTKFWMKFRIFHDVILSWRHYVTFITLFFDDWSLIFYFSLGFLNSTFKSFEKISHYGFYWVRSKSPKSFHFSIFHEILWFWQKSSHFWSGTFWPVICLIHPYITHHHLWSFLTWVLLNFVLIYGPLGVQSCIEISKNDNFRVAVFELSQNLNLRSIHLHHVTLSRSRSFSVLVIQGHILLAWSRWNPIHRFQNSIDLTFYK